MASVYDSLAVYLGAKRAARPGWVAAYEEHHCRGEEPAWLTGHYQGLLDALIGALGQDTAERLVAARMAVDRALNTPTPQEGGR
jgi:hypothetical protein